MTRRIATITAATALGLSGTAAAHPHMVNGHPIAHGQNHYAFVNGLSCDTYAPAGSAAVGPAWYGLETAHHGPDGATPGKGDGCYGTTGGVAPGADINNPTIG